MGQMNGLNLSTPLPISIDHELVDFDSGEPSLDQWLKKRALKNQASGASRCFVLCNNKKVIGYYSLSAGAINHEATPKAMRRNMPDPLPILLLGRLAIDRNYHNKGLGSALLRDAMIRSVSVAGDAGAFAILVHALSEQAKRYYMSRGFVESPLQPMTLMMTLETARSILVESD
jgi:predicted N-acetyltransferase YhbS